MSIFTEKTHETEKKNPAFQRKLKAWTASLPGIIMAVNLER